VLRIASVALEVPVYADGTERNLNRGAGLLAGTAAPGGDGNVAIVAHRDGYFRALEGVRVGDKVELATPTQTRWYRVAEITIVEPTDLRTLDATDTPAVTLVTCYPFHFVGHAPQRYIVRALALP
jgi:sortase A